MLRIHLPCVVFLFIDICILILFKLKASDREIADIQSEFENERTDYLETIRKQERQIKLQSQILDKIVPTLSKECNYR